MIETRLLDPSNKADVAQLSEILNHYLEDSRTRPNQVWSETAATNTIGRMFINFNERFKKHIFIAGEFNNGVLEKIYIGEKLAMYLEDVSNPDRWPYWFTSLIYSKNKKIKNTHNELYDIATLVVREMEKQRYYSFFTFIKFPIKRQKNFVEQLDNNFPFSIMPRYHNVIEAIIDSSTSADHISSQFLKIFAADTARNLNTNHKLMLSSHHLKNEYRDFSKELGI